MCCVTDIGGWNIEASLVFLEGAQSISNHGTTARMCMWLPCGRGRLNTLPHDAPRFNNQRVCGASTTSEWKLRAQIAGADGNESRDTMEQRLTYSDKVMQGKKDKVGLLRVFWDETCVTLSMDKVVLR